MGEGYLVSRIRFSVNLEKSLLHPFVGEEGNAGIVNLQFQFILYLQKPNSRSWKEDETTPDMKCHKLMDSASQVVFSHITD